jgi:pyrimidine-nucleoside phosphorylase
MKTYSPLDIIAKKRDAGELSQEEIEFLVQGAARGTWPDYQLAAWLMAAYLQGLNLKETRYLTYSMMRSGEILDLTAVRGVKVDKHSTGGVGDKVSLVLAPLVAAAGVPVPMMAGRGLGHTGGTIDKLEAIPGFNTNLSVKTFAKQVKEIGVAITAQTKELAPADGKLYALRDVTATVASIPLIAGSIMAKKLAAGIDALVLDVKVGDGAFIKKQTEARRLAKIMVALGKGLNKKVVAILTSMEEPLGWAVGNALEVKEAIKTLRGQGPPDLEEVTLTLGSWMLYLGAKAKNLIEARRILQDCLFTGKALEKFRQMIKAQGGNGGVVDDENMLPRAPGIKGFKSPQKGYVKSIKAELIGKASVALGAGRRFLGEPLDPAVGIILNKKVGEKVEKGEPLAFFHYREESKLRLALELAKEAYTLGDKIPPKKPLILGKI